MLYAMALFGNPPTPRLVFLLISPLIGRMNRCWNHIALVVLSISATAMLCTQPVHPADSLFLFLAFPKGDTVHTSYSRMRYAACTQPDAEAFAHGEPVHVYPDGAFVGMTDIPYGISHLSLKVKRKNGDSLMRTIVFERPAPMPDLPHDSLAIERSYMHPAEDLWLSAGCMFFAFNFKEVRDAPLPSIFRASNRTFRCRNFR
jgi:hypothetical protein